MTNQSGRLSPASTHTPHPAPAGRGGAGVGTLSSQEHRMDEGAFDQNFTWYEWGFVDPTEIPLDDLAVPPESGTPRILALRLLEQWDEEHRWPT